MSEQQNEIKDDYTVDPKISGWPYRSFKQFKNFAKRYTGDKYWPAIALLLERSKRLELYEGAFLPEDEEHVEEEAEEQPEVVGLSGLTEK